MADRLDVDEMRETFQRVAAYRAVCQMVRARAGRTIFNGLFFVGIAVAFYYLVGVFHPFFLVYAAIGFGEMLVGLWKRTYPSAEGVLADAVLQFAFAASIGARQILAMQAGLNPNAFSVLIAAWVFFDAVRTFQAYLALRRAFTERPTADHLAYVDELVAEIRAADPETDSQILDLPTFPHLKAKLLGDLTILVEARSGKAVAAAREDVRIDREEGRRGRLPTAYLTVEGQEFPGFGLSAANWKNYAAWKTEGGEPPPPPKVRPVREGPDDD
jgi:hypothetical protein